MKALINSGQQAITCEYINELETQMNDKVKIIRTDHPVLSALLTEQAQRAKIAGVRFDIDVKLNSEMKIDSVDLCIILGNLLDNALEACELLNPEAQKYIEASIIQRNNILVIKVLNTYAPGNALRLRSGKHGFGQKNIRQAITKYNGIIDV